MQKNPVQRSTEMQALELTSHPRGLTSFKGDILHPQDGQKRNQHFLGSKGLLILTRKLTVGLVMTSNWSFRKQLQSNKIVVKKMCMNLLDHVQPTLLCKSKSQFDIVDALHL